jgi:MutL protein/Methylaspartate mutase E chain (MutE)
LNDQDLVLLYDLGSTFTKVAAVDVEAGRLVAWAKAASTVTTDITEGLEAALREAERQGGFSRARARLRLASSSAAGGLRLVAVGLVPELTGEAARRAALGAGARVVGTLSYEMTAGEVRELEGLDPDIVLLAGGTDGGNKTVLVHNARRLTERLDYADEAALLRLEVRAIMTAVLTLGEGDVGLGAVRAFETGVLDVPFSPHRANKGLAIPVRDDCGAIRFLDFGNIPLPDSAKAYHRQRVNERAATEGRVPSFEMVLDDVYAVQSGHLIGRPEHEVVTRAGCPEPSP